jgi:hypothetical protein
LKAHAFWTAPTSLSLEAAEQEVVGNFDKSSQAGVANHGRRDKNSSTPVL